MIKRVKKLADNQFISKFNKMKFINDKKFMVLNYLLTSNGEPSQEICNLPVIAVNDSVVLDDEVKNCCNSLLVSLLSRDYSLRQEIDELNILLKKED